MLHAMKIIITRSCNFRCSYCYEQYTENAYNREETFTDDMIDKCILFIIKYILFCSDITEKNKIHLSFFGGEALQYPEKILYFVKKLSKFHKKIRFLIFTNGFLINERIDTIKEIQSYPDMTLIVRVSYDFYLQDIQRKQGTHDLILQNIKILLYNKIKIETLSVIDKDNNKYFDKVYDEFKELYDNLPNDIKPYYIDASYSNNCFNYDSLKLFDYTAVPQFEYVKSENNKKIRIPFYKLTDEKYTERHEIKTYIYNVYPDGNVYISETSRYTLNEQNKPYDFCLGSFVDDSCIDIIKAQKKYCEWYKNNSDIEKCSKCEQAYWCKYQPWLELNEDYCKVMKFVYDHS